MFARIVGSLDFILLVFFLNGTLILGLSPNLGGRILLNYLWLLHLSQFSLGRLVVVVEQFLGESLLVVSRRHVLIYWL